MKTTFKKQITTSTASTEVIIEVTEGFNKKGEEFRNVNFVNTSPYKSFNAASKYENNEMEYEQLERVLNDDGFFAGR